MKLLSSKKSLVAHLLPVFLAVAMLISLLPRTAAAKSVYVIGDHHTAQFDAYNINPDGTIAGQVSYNLQQATDPAGLGIWVDPATSPPEGAIFITSEFSMPGAEIWDAKTMTYLGTAPGALNQAGIDVDDSSNIVYSVRRSTSDLYVYDWDPVAQTLSPKAGFNPFSLPNCVGAFGIALDELEGILWVADPAVVVVPSAPEVNELEDNTVFANRNIFASAGQLIINGSLTAGGDRDIFEITGLGAGTVDVEVISGTFDSILGLFNAGGTLIATDDDGGSGLLSRLSNVTPDNGTVRIGITGYSDFGFNGSHTQTGSYKIAVVASAGIVRGIVRAYDVSDLNNVTEDTSLSFTPSHTAVDVAVDRQRSIVYTVSMSYGASTPPGAGSNLLSKYDLATSTETTGNLGCHGVGVAVDELTGYVYVTVSPYCSQPGQIQVWDTATSPWNQLQVVNLAASPAGIAIGNVGVNPLNLSKTDGIEENTDPNCIASGGTITYDICYDNNDNVFDVHNVTITDNLPAEVSFVSASGGGIYDSNTHTVTWNIGDLPAGDPGGCVELVVQVQAGTPGGTIITNFATIVSDETPETTVDDSTKVCETIPVDVDIKPTSCPNPLNVVSKGVLPVAILGTKEFDVHMIDAASVCLSGVSAIRSNYEDVTTPVSDGNECECTTEGPDGYIDLTLKFKTQEIVGAIGDVNDGDILSLPLTGVLHSGTPIEGSDCIVIRGKAKSLHGADINEDGVVNTLDFAILAENWLESNIVQD